jgi:hypothetical protein
MNIQKKNNSAFKNIIGPKNNASKNFGKTVKNGTLGYGKIIFFVVLILFIALLIYIIYVAVTASSNASAESPIIVSSVIDANIARPPFKLPELKMGMNHSFSTWIYVKDWNYKFGQYKNILWKGNPDKDGDIHSPSMWLYPLTNSLRVVTSTSDVSGIESCDIANIPLMTWVHIVYVLNNRTVDIYINGKLERSCALRGIPQIKNDPVFITTLSSTKTNSKKQEPGFYGKVGKTQYFTKALLPNDVANLNQQGPLGNSQYQLKFFDKGSLIKFSDGNNITNKDEDLNKNKS